MLCLLSFMLLNVYWSHIWLIRDGDAVPVFEACVYTPSLVTMSMECCSVFQMVMFIECFTLLGSLRSTVNLCVPTDLKKKNVLSICVHKSVKVTTFVTMLTRYFKTEWLYYRKKNTKQYLLRAVTGISAAWVVLKYTQKTAHWCYIHGKQMR